MTATTETAPCWVLPALPWDDSHYPSQADAEQAAAERGHDLTAEPLPEPCVTAVCDSCGEEYNQDAESWTGHFPSEQEAREYVTASGWRVTKDGTFRCRQCK